MYNSLYAFRALSIPISARTFNFLLRLQLEETVRTAAFIAKKWHFICNVQTAS